MTSPTKRYIIRVMHTTNDFIKKFPPLGIVLLAASFFSILAFLFVETASEDVWWHIAIGQDIIRNTAVPVIEKYTAASLGRPYHDSQWLFQTIAAMAYNAAGMPGTQIFTLLLWVATFSFTFLSAKKCSSTETASILVFIAAMASSERFIPRTDVVSYFMISAYYYLLMGEKELSGKKIGLLILLQVI